MSDAKSDWWKSTFGDTLGGAMEKGVDWVENKASEIKQDAAAVIDKGEDLAKAAVGEIKDDANKAEDWAKGKVATATAAVKKEAGDLKLKAVGDQSGGAVPRPMEADCTPVHGQVPGPKNHLFCSTHGHVVDTDSKMIVANSVASYVKDGVAKAAGNLAKHAAPQIDPEKLPVGTGLAREIDAGGPSGGSSDQAEASSASGGDLAAEHLGRGDDPPLPVPDGCRNAVAKVGFLIHDDTGLGGTTGFFVKAGAILEFNNFGTQARTIRITNNIAAASSLRVQPGGNVSTFIVARGVTGGSVRCDGFPVEIDIAVCPS